jgi:hypothetical protein
MADSSTEKFRQVQQKSWISVPVDFDPFELVAKTTFSEYVQGMAYFNNGPSARYLPVAEWFHSPLAMKSRGWEGVGAGNHSATGR